MTSRPRCSPRQQPRGRVWWTVLAGHSSRVQRTVARLPLIRCYPWPRWSMPMVPTTRLLIARHCGDTSSMPTRRRRGTGKRAGHSGSGERRGSLESSLTARATSPTLPWRRLTTDCVNLCLVPTIPVKVNTTTRKLLKRA